MAISTKLSVLKSVPGLAGRCNDVIVKSSSSTPRQDILVYFGGDVQDFENCMQNHAESKKYSEWSLESTAQILCSNFPSKDIFVVRPSRVHLTFSCYDNFVAGKHKFGVPKFQSTYNALKHLQELLKSSYQQLRVSNADESSQEYSLEHKKLTLMGFSKGCIVLNQFLHEFYYYQGRLDQDLETCNFINQIESMWWLDGGHGGFKDAWITNKDILQSFAKLRIHAHVHVTPFQIEDSHRPWIRQEEKTFCDVLQELKVPLQRTVHFSDAPRSIESHFKVLKSVGSTNSS